MLAQHVPMFLLIERNLYGKKKEKERGVTKEE